MELGIKGKVAMVAAASKGIGLATARMLAEEGCLVSICARTESSLSEACQTISGTVRGYVCDVSSASNLERWVGHTQAELGRVQILVTNTGGPPAGPLSTMTDEQWQGGFDSTLMNVVRLSRLVSPEMTESGWGRIVHITSLVAKEPNAVLPISSTLRAGLMALVRLQALEMGPSGVTVNAVLPGHTLTDRQTHLASIRAKDLGISVEEALQKQAESVPLRRLASADEIASAIVFLCSEQGDYISGENLLVDGGITKALA